MDGDDLHLIWTDFRDSEYGEIYYKRKLAAGAEVEESLQPQASSGKLQATVLRRLPAGAVAFDVMGRRALNPKPGVYFIPEEAGRREQEGIRVRKVVIQQ